MKLVQYKEQKKMKISELTQEQLELLADHKPEWMADNKTEWMTACRPEWMAEHRPYWMAEHRPYWMAEHRPYWMADHRPVFLDHPDIEIPEYIRKFLEAIEKLPVLLKKEQKKLNKAIEVKILVLGKPVPKGSTLSFLHSKTKKIITRQQNADSLYGWQDKIGYGARKEFEKPVECAVSLKMTFFLKHPKHMKHVVNHIKRPDIDKLARAVMDALTGIVYNDDSQVNNLLVCKDYDFNKLEGCEIEITYQANGIMEDGNE